ncbi:hypothetical protein RHMOL_Rhmol05G0121600 [Rhododendron molle]|nr:hypothetical protein RHMOL_Rhmol05G0121600 [Rhododendron molle]
MCKVWGRQEDKRVKVSFSDKGQPISNNCILSHFLGTIARNGKYAPLHYKSWPKMPQVYKDNMFSLVLVGDYVNFKSVANPTDVVGKGRIASTNPSIEVGDYVNFKSVANPTNVVGKGRITGTDPSIEKMAYAAVCNAIIGRWNGFRSICSGTEKCLDK